MAGTYYDRTTYWEYLLDGVDYSSINAVYADIVTNGAGDGGFNRPVHILVSVDNAVEDVTINGGAPTATNYLKIHSTETGGARPLLEAVAPNGGAIIFQDNNCVLANLRLQPKGTGTALRTLSTENFVFKNCKHDDPAVGRSTLFFNSRKVYLSEWEGGIYLNSTSHFIIEDSTISGGGGIYSTFIFGGTCGSVIIRRTLFNAILTNFGADKIGYLLVDSCIFNGVPADLHGTFALLQQVDCINNVFYQAQLSIKGRGHTVRNNIFYDIEYPIRMTVHGVMEETENQLANSIGRNCFYNITSNHYGQWYGVNKDTWAAWQAVAGEVGSLENQDPLFTTPGSAFTLQSGSVLRTAIANRALGAGSMLDYDSADRMANDFTNMGAYHYGFDIPVADFPAVGTVFLGTSYDNGNLIGTRIDAATGVVLLGSPNYGDPGSPLVPAYAPDFPLRINVRSIDTVQGLAGRWVAALAAKYQLNEKFGIDNVSENGTYDPAPSPPTQPTLTADVGVEDQATIAITGSDAGSSNDVFVSLVGAAWPSSPTFNKAGNASQVLPLSPGLYRGKVESTGSGGVTIGTSDPILFRVNGPGTTEVFYRVKQIRNMIGTPYKTLDLEKIDRPTTL